MKLHKKSLAIVSLCIFIIIAILGVIFVIKSFRQMHVSSAQFELIVAPTSTVASPTPDPLKPLNVVILGYGGSGHEGGSLTDTIILAHINPRSEKTFLISIPRDIWLALPLEETASVSAKINTAFAFGNDSSKFPHKPIAYTGEAGGGNLAKYAVQQVTGLIPDYFVAINFAGFLNIIDLLGGVNVNVPYSFVDNFYPLKGSETDPCGKSPEEIELLTATMAAHLLEREFPCRYESLAFTAGPTTMDAMTALKFVRSRHSDNGGGDFGRAMRQQALVEAIKEKALSINSLTKVIPIINTVSKNVTTDTDMDFIQDFFTRFTDVPNYPLSTIVLSTKNTLLEDVSSDGQYILVPKGNWETIHQYINQEIQSRL